MTDAHADVVGREAEAAKSRDRHGDDFGVGLGSSDTKQVDVPLPVFAKPTTLRPLGSKEIWHCKPLGRHGEGSALGRSHPGERGCELRAECVVSVTTASLEGEQLADDAVAALDGVQLEVLKSRSVYLIKAVPDRRRSPGVFDVATRRHVFWVEVASTLRGLKGVSGAGHGRADYRAGAYWASSVLA